jgi:abortive infection bacteriophage resistance protein
MLIFAKFIGMEFIMLKQPATYEQQIKKLLEHGCEIPDVAFCEQVLAQVSYYRLSAYFMPFKKTDGKYKSGTNFVNVYNLYEFDRKLRRHIFTMIEELEVYLRAQFSYFHSHKYGADGYMDSTNFNNRHNHERFSERINSLMKSNNKVAFVKHHIDEYGGKFPLWVITELFTFGMLSYFYADMLTNDQKELAFNTFDTTVSKMKSWLYCCTDLRNLCAHYGRLYHTVFSAVPAQLPNVNKDNENSLFAAIMALRALYPDELKWNYVFYPSLLTLFFEYNNVVDLKYIGFPENWQDLIRK